MKGSTKVVVQQPGTFPRAQSRMTLLDLLDRVLAKGVVAYGDIVLSIADLDLVYLNLRAVLSSIGTLEETHTGGTDEQVQGIEIPHPQAPPHPPLSLGGEREHSGNLYRSPRPLKGGEGGGEGVKKIPNPQRMSPLGSSAPRFRRDLPGAVQPVERLKLDPTKTQRGLAKLALTLIHLLQKLMERQAIRRMEAGTLTAEQVEQVGQAFQQLDEQMQKLTKQFGLTAEDLNLDLGPLGQLV